MTLIYVFLPEVYPLKFVKHALNIIESNDRTILDHKGVYSFELSSDQIIRMAISMASTSLSDNCRSGI